MKLRLGKKWLLSAGIVLLAGVGLLLLRNSPLAPITKVTTLSAGQANLQPTLFGIAVVESRRNILVGPTTAGRVARVLVDQGDRVEAGQVLAEIDPVDLEARLGAARHAQVRAESSLTASVAQVREAESRLATAEASAQRYASLRGQGFVSAEAERAKGHEARAATAAQVASVANVSAARAEADRLKAEMDALSRQLNNTRLRAPVSGFIVSRDIEPGSTAVAGQSVLRMVEADSFWLRVRIDQGRSVGLLPELPASIVLRSRPGEQFPGKVVRVEQLSDAVTEERIAMVSFDSLPTGLTLNEMAEVTVRMPARTSAIVVPPAAIVRQAGQGGVFVAVEGKARFIPVRTGLRTEGGIEILAGLQGGEAVIVSRTRPISEGDRIRVTDESGARS